MPSSSCHECGQLWACICPGSSTSRRVPVVQVEASKKRKVDPVRPDGSLTGSTVQELTAAIHEWEAQCAEITLECAKMTKRAEDQQTVADGVQTVAEDLHARLNRLDLRASPAPDLPQPAAVPLFQTENRTKIMLERVRKKKMQGDPELLLVYRATPDIRTQSLEPRDIPLPPLKTRSTQNRTKNLCSAAQPSSALARQNNEQGAR